MRQDKIFKALEYVDSEYLESAENSMQNERKNKKIRLYKQLTVAAACLLIVFAFLPIVLFMAENSDVEIPEYTDAIFSAEEVADLFGTDMMEGPTNAYTGVYVPDEKYLYLSEIPDDDFLSIYRYDCGKGKELNKGEFQDFSDKILQRLETSLDVDFPSYEIEYSDKYSVLYEIDIDTDRYSVFAGQNSTFEYIYVFPYGRYNHLLEITTLDGEKITVLQTQSDEEIIASLDSIKNKLFDIFGVQFTDAKVIREYGSYEENGVEFLSVYFYNSDEHPLNDAVGAVPKSDFILLSFDNDPNWSGDIVSDTYLSNVDIRYYKYRQPTEKRYTTTAMAERISLEEAEALLEAGYVFGGHTCELCMAEQPPVDFSDYDYVELEYVFGYSYNKESVPGIPFYAFYKYIGESRNGNKTYAKTYVPAIKVSGLEEYFKMQESEHINNTYYEEPIS